VPAELVVKFQAATQKQGPGYSRRRYYGASLTCRWSDSPWLRVVRDYVSGQVNAGIMAAVPRRPQAVPRYVARVLRARSAQHSPAVASGAAAARGSGSRAAHAV
jgi:hypothetical protein